MSRANQWFVPGDGIAREVITADIQRYLGPDALVRPGTGTGEYQGQPGYWITAYRTLTSQMIQDLKMDSQRYQTSPASAAPRTQPADPYSSYQQPSGRDYPAQSAYSSYPAQTPDPYGRQPATQTTPYSNPSAAAAAPGYYIASDGRQYPLSQQPQSSRNPQSGTSRYSTR
ncbi:unnamed protein product [Alternaria alternata]